MKIRLVILLVTILLLSAALASHASTIQLPQTGQATCYDAAGAVIPCAGTGQDGDWLAGKPWPTPRFTDNGDGTIADNLTGLVWLKNANCTDTSGGITKTNGWLYWTDALTWSNDLSSGTCGLSDGSVAGDWRLPNRKELQSLTDRENSGLPPGHPFTNIQMDYWTSSTYEMLTSVKNAWVVLADGGVFAYGKNWTAHVWPVRDGR